MYNNPYNNYFANYMAQNQRYQPIEQMNQNLLARNMQAMNYGLQGKIVDNIEVVKAMDIPLDGSISYFPLADGSSIITKQLQQDGTSKTLLYKVVSVQEENEENNKYITEERLQDVLNTEVEVVKELKEEIKAIKRQIRDITEDLKDIQKPKTRKGEE